MSKTSGFSKGSIVSYVGGFIIILILLCMQMIQTASLYALTAEVGRWSERESRLLIRECIVVTDAKPAIIRCGEQHLSSETKKQESGSKELRTGGNYDE